MSEEELLSAIKDVVDRKLLGMDGLSFEFYMKFWIVIGAYAEDLYSRENVNVGFSKAYMKRGQEG